MDSDDPQGLRACLSELVRYVGWPDQDVSSRDFYCALPHGKGGLALQNEKDLIIGMAVEPGAFIRRELHPEKRNGDAFIVLSLKQIAMLKLLFGNDRCHVFSLFPSSCITWSNGVDAQVLGRHDVFHLAFQLAQ